MLTQGKTLFRFRRLKEKIAVPSLYKLSCKHQITSTGQKEPQKAALK